MGKEIKPAGAILELSKELMRNSNPVVIPRNQRVEDALESAVNEGSLDSLHGY